MAKRSRNRKGCKWFDSAHASLCLLGSYLLLIGFFKPLEDKVKLKQKVLKYTPIQKLEMLFVSLLAGAKAVYQTGTTLRVDRALQCGADLWTTARTRGVVWTVAPVKRHPVRALARRLSPLLLLGLVALVLYAANLFVLHSASSTQSSVTPPPRAQPAIGPRATYARPTTGVIRASSTPWEPSYLLVKNGSDSDGVVIVTSLDGVPVVSGVVQAGDSMQLGGIADGDYRVHFSKGEAGDPARNRFTQAVTHQRFNDVFTYRRAGGQYTSWEVTLYPVTFGNAGTSNIGVEKFPSVE